MLVLGIESSCDETAAALVRADGTVLSDVVASQIKEHAPYGGVVPELASRAHLRAIAPVIERALQATPGGLADVDAIAVTHGPGLAGALLVGVSTAKALAWGSAKPLVGVNHLRGHLFAAFVRRPELPQVEQTSPSFPFVALLASGGHTALYLVRSFADVEQLGQTRDDAAGEAFDKVAKLIGLGYPGGPAVDRLAAQGNPRAVSLPLPMLHNKRLDFSFSGLKTAVAHHVEAHGVPTDVQTLADLCASVQRCIVEVLARKSLAACQQYGVREFVLAGGVAANRGLRARSKELCEPRGVRVHIPPAASCTDNAAMIAFAGLKQFEAGDIAGLDLEIFARAEGIRRGRILD